MEGSSMDITKEQQFIRLNKDIDILMTAGCYDEAVEKIDKALPLTKEIANKTNDFKKIKLMKENYDRLMRKREICLEHLDVKPQGSATQTMAEAKKVKQAAPKAKPVAKKEPIDVDAALAELDELIGLDEVKKEIHAKVNQINNFNQRRAQGLKVPKMTNHMVFTGNPGTGKTTVARIVSKIYTALGVISGNDLEDSLLEVQRNNLVAGYVGQTARQTQEAIDKAMGGILFIDEAYSLAPKGGGTDFGQEAIDTLLIGMENNRDNLVVIAAGYENEMERFINSNPGLESRFKNFIHFADYNGEELFKIFELQLKKNDYVLAPDAEVKLKGYLNKLYENRDRNFANGRDVRNLFEEIIERQASRLAKVSNPSREDLATLTMEDMYF